MSRPFPPLGALPAADLSDSDRAYVDSLKPHQRAEAEWTMRAISAVFERAAGRAARKEAAE